MRFKRQTPRTWRPQLLLWAWLGFVSVLGMQIAAASHDASHDGAAIGDHCGVCILADSQDDPVFITPTGTLQVFDHEFSAYGIAQPSANRPVTNTAIRAPPIL